MPLCVRVWVCVYACYHSRNKLLLNSAICYVVSLHKITKSKGELTKNSDHVKVIEYKF